MQKGDIVADAKGNRFVITSTTHVNEISIFELAPEAWVADPEAPTVEVVGEELEALFVSTDRSSVKSS